MSPAKKNILITGLPGVGKTTLVKKLCEAMSDLRPCGFYTEEIREHGVRQGFALVGLDGRCGTLSHVDVKSPVRVGGYGVALDDFERFLDGLVLPASGSGLAVIDEIGKMECFSRKFSLLVDRILASDTPLAATVALKGGGFISEVKRRPDIELFEISQRNRDDLLPELVQYLTDH